MEQEQGARLGQGGGRREVSAAHASAWVARFAELVPGGGAVLDLAAGGGRHAQLFLARGHPVTAVDRDTSRLRAVRHPALCVVEADLEGAPWPLGEQRFAGVVVTNYLWRPLLPRIGGAVAAGGVLIYETFMRGNERHGKPSNPAFLLEPDELRRAFVDLTEIAFELG